MRYKFKKNDAVDFFGLWYAVSHVLFNARQRTPAYHTYAQAMVKNDNIVIKEAVWKSGILRAFV